MYANENLSPQFESFDPNATIVIADRAMDWQAETYGKGVTLDAETISARLRDGWVARNAYESQLKIVQDAIRAVRDAADEAESDEMIEFLGDLANILKITLTKSYKVSLTFSVDAVVDLPIGSDDSDVDADDFQLYLEYNNYDCELTDFDVTYRNIDDIDSAE